MNLKKFTVPTGKAEKIAANAISPIAKAAGEAVGDLPMYKCSGEASGAKILQNIANKNSSK